MDEGLSIFTAMVSEEKHMTKFKQRENDLLAGLLQSTEELVVAIDTSIQEFLTE